MVYRIRVEAAGPDGAGGSEGDEAAASVRRQITALGADPGPLVAHRLFLIDTDVDPGSVRRIAEELLADPIAERATIEQPNAQPDSGSRIEVHLKPGVMDPVAASAQTAIADMGLGTAEVRTGRAYVFEQKLPEPRLQQIATRVLANGVIESVYFEPYFPTQFSRGREDRFELRHVNIRDLSDGQLQKLSREGHLFLSLAEMKAIQAYFREQSREPTDIELETLAQTWSEHCVHKTLKSAVELKIIDTQGKTLATRHYRNLIKETIFASTQELMRRPEKQGFCLSVFSDNAGVIAFDEKDAVCFKVETHNHPSAIEPYGGSATGVGGVIRDILGTGLGARPVANTDVFCVGFPDFGSKAGQTLPRGLIHPRRILQQVVAGVRDYGNRMGIPTVNGAVYFDDRYLGNPLVFCGCVGLIPRDRVTKQTRAGDAIVVMGGRTGRDGIHGATFSSAELTDTHADEFSHAVQIGNAITEKKLADVILAARDRGLFSAITDCGAGGLSSAIGEMGEATGARVELDKVPLKYAGLRYDEIWISEAQERMVLSVPQEHLDQLLRLAKAEDVEATVIGRFGVEGKMLELFYHQQPVGRLSMDFLHGGLPSQTRQAVALQATPRAGKESTTAKDVRATLLAKLAHPNIASKHWIIRQYDHEVQGGSVIKPLVGPRQIGPSDAAVIRPKLSSYRGVALGCGLTPWIEDPYEMTLAAIDEAVRNIVAVGGDLAKTAILDNFCWPSVDDERTMGTLVRACEACRDAALAYGIPFISGKDSLHNQFTDQETGRIIRIPSTLLISAIAVLDDVRRCITMDLKRAGNRIALVWPGELSLSERPAIHRTLAEAIATGQVRSVHDISDGGLAVAAAEMCIASGLGMDLTVPATVDPFAEPLASYLLEIDPSAEAELKRRLGAAVHVCGNVVGDPRLRLVASGTEVDIAIGILTQSWRGTLDW